MSALHRPEDDAHVVPVVEPDEPAHRVEPTCWCQPVMGSKNASGAVVWIHKQALDMPAYEMPSWAAVLVDSWAAMPEIAANRCRHAPAKSKEERE
jgi:hypothetical protein